jgi:hypothetical protein
MAVCVRNAVRLAIDACSPLHLYRGPAEDISRPKAEKHLKALRANSHKLQCRDSTVNVYPAGMGISAQSVTEKRII